MKHNILPFIYIDGVPTFTDSEIMNWYDIMETDGTARDVFCQGDVTNRDEFLRLVKSPLNMFHAIMSDDNTTVVGVFWLNRFEMKTARLHFCLFREWWKFSDQIFVDVVGYVYRLESDGVQLFTIIIGVFNSKLKHVKKYLLRNGAKVVGVIPDYYWDSFERVACEATIVYYPKGENKHENLQ